MKRIEIIAGEAAYTNLRTFDEVEKLNETVRKYKDMIADMPLRKDLKKNLLTILEYLKRYSCKFFGVSFKGKRKIAADLNMSDRTIIRLCQHLEKLGFIKQYAMKRSSDMQQTSNAIVIQPLKMEQKQENVRPAQPKMSDQKNHNLKQNIILKNTYSEEQKPLKVTFYQKFKYFLHSTIGEDNQKLVSKLYGVYLAHSNVLVKHGAFDKQDVESVAYEALRTAVMSTKTRKIKNIAGWFNGVLDRKLTQFIYQEAEAALEEEALTELEASFQKL